MIESVTCAQVCAEDGIAITPVVGKFDQGLYIHTLHWQAESGKIDNLMEDNYLLLSHVQLKGFIYCQATIPCRDPHNKNKSTYHQVWRH